MTSPTWKQIKTVHNLIDHQKLNSLVQLPKISKHFFPLHLSCGTCGLPESCPSARHDDRKDIMERTSVKLVPKDFRIWSARDLSATSVQEIDIELTKVLHLSVGQFVFMTALQL